MVQHLVSIIAALSLTLWATVVERYEQLSPTPLSPPEFTVGIEAEPTPFETVVEQIVQIASSTPVQTPREPRPVPTTTPSVPLTPPLPVPPPITATTSVPIPPVVPDVDARISTEALLKGSIVNIICLQGGGLRGSSGSGVVIDPRGIIMTVAHVAQNFILTDYPEENTGTCYIRTGSPARNAYSAELIYISSDWVRENPGTFLSTQATGTGEDDYGFVIITGSLTGSPTHALSFVPLASPDTEVEEGDTVGIGSYAAEFLSSSQVRSSLYPTISFAPVSDVYTFGRNTLDIFSVKAGPAAQEGSSGGAIINEDRELIGLITTRTVRPDLSLRELQALTMDHVRRSFRSEMGTSLDTYLKSSPSFLIDNFKDTKEDLLRILEEAIESAQR